MMTNNSIGKGIRQLRLLHNLSQKHIAEKLGMTQGNFARIENGHINVSMERLEIMAALFGCTPQAITDLHINDAPVSMEGPREVINFQISRELKELYEGYIRLLEETIKELKERSVPDVQEMLRIESDHTPA